MLYASTQQFAIYHGDNRQILPTLAENSVDAIVTDPPYELGFMGKSWDASGVAFDPATWREALRVLKPGGHLIAFSGSRTYHRMAVAIEDAGFEIRDQIMWIYGSGFPKSHDVSKGIDKNNGETDRLIRFTLWMRTTGLKVKDVTQVLVENDLIGENGTIAGHYFAMKSTSQPAIPTVAMWKVIRPLIADVPEWVDELVDRIEAEREVVGKYETDMGGLGGKRLGNTGGNITTASTPAAKQWQGWGTALKPAHEPMVLARKPLVGTVAANVLTYGTGGLNIDGARVASGDNFDGLVGRPIQKLATQLNDETDEEYKARVLESPGQQAALAKLKELGRWPANVIHDGSDEVVAGFPDTKSGSGVKNTRQSSGNLFSAHTPTDDFFAGDSGSAARFFYCAKASKRDRNDGLDGFEVKQTLGGGGLTEVGGAYGSIKAAGQNHHPTVKPTDLMRYLCRLITPPNGTVLDPFMGSGSTGKAAMYEGFKFIGVEMTDEYLPIAKARIEFAVSDNEGFLL